MTKLMPMIGQGKRGLETAFKWLKATKMGAPLRIIQPIKPHRLCRFIITIAQNHLRHLGRSHWHVKIIAKQAMCCHKFSHILGLLKRLHCKNDVEGENKLDISLG